MKKLLLILVLVLSMTSLVFADDFGHEGINDLDPDVEAMLEYALEDEVLAYSTYEAIVEAFEVTKPFTNIMKAEAKHIELVEELMLAYDITPPQVDPSDYITLPTSLEEAYKAGVQAEIDNIALYENFLVKYELPEDVQAVFEQLISGSEKHLKAFERQVESQNRNKGRGRRN